MTGDSTEAELLAKLDGNIVPLRWQQYCKQPDQFFWWNELRISYQLILTGLNEYFSGSVVETKDLSPSESDWLLDWVDYWTNLYAVIQASWPYLKGSQLHKSKRCVVREQRGETYKLRDDLTPGEFLVTLIQLRALAEFSECLLPFSNFSANQAKQLLLATRDLSSGKEVQPKKLKSLALAEKQSEKDFGEFYADLFMCLKVAEVAAKKDKRVREGLERFYKTSARMRDVAITGLRNRNSYQWEKGELKFGTKDGGTYT